MTGWSVGTLASMKHNVNTGGAVGVQLQPVVSHGATMRKVMYSQSIKDTTWPSQLDIEFLHIHVHVELYFCP